MPMPKHVSRKITVDGINYRWRVGSLEYLSEWQEPEAGTIDPQWIQQAKRFGLGQTAKVAHSVKIELFDNPVSNLIVKVTGTAIDGFLGIESDIKIRPGLIRQIIDAALATGWQPQQQGQFDFGIVEDPHKKTEPIKPVLLFLPELDNHIEGYENTNTPILLWQKPSS